MKKYDTYKTTKYDWVGSIPSSWTLSQIKYECKVTDGTHFSPATTETGKPYVTVSNVKDDKIDVKGALLISSEDFDLLEKQGCRPSIGDILLSKDGTVGRSAVVEEDNNFVCLSSLGIISPSKNLDSKFLKYQLDSILLQDQMIQAMAGSALRRITINKINEFRILVPSKKEQKNIVKFLEHKVSKIDQSVFAVNRQIEDLKSYRQSVISEAVTKGLNPNVQFKDSGVNWIGEIPLDWSCLPMKRGMVIKNGSDYKSVQADQGYPVYGSGGRFAYAKEFLYDGEALLLGRKGTIDKPLYVNCKFWTVDTMFYAIPQKHVCCKYMFYQAQTIPFGLYSTNTALPSMTQSALLENPMCFPPFDEQKEIADYLDKKTLKIDNAIKSLEAQREDLKALRQSVISEAVTGKIDVRDWKLNNEQ